MQRTRGKEETEKLKKTTEGLARVGLLSLRTDVFEGSVYGSQFY
jgi:hypothetical protein